jgi:uncharacterized membrane protein
MAPIRPKEEGNHMADRVIVAAFDTQNQAYDTARALQQLHDRDTIKLVRAAIITKDDKGNLSIPDTKHLGSAWGLLGGGIMGALVGALLGPVGAAAGAAATAAAAGAAIGGATGAYVGATADLVDLGLSEAFIEEVSYNLKPGHSALIAEVGEGSTEPVDAAVTQHHGRIYREELG